MLGFGPFVALTSKTIYYIKVNVSQCALSGNLVSLCVITQASLDFKTSFLRLVACFAHTFTLLQGLHRKWLLLIFLTGVNAFSLRHSVHCLKHHNIQRACSQRNLQTSGAMLFYILLGFYRVFRKKCVTHYWSP